jgi:hypothetical protein
VKAAKIITALLIVMVQSSAFATSRAGSAFISLNGGYEFFASKRNIQNTGVPYQCIEPFLLAGVGATGLNPNGNSANYEGNINAGAGAQWFINDIIAFRAEARDFYTIIGGKNDVFLGAGISFYFKH